MQNFSKFAFGISATQQVAKRIQGYISVNFANEADAAKNLGITRQRLFSYTSGKSFPGADIVDLFLEKWGLDLLGGKPRVTHPTERRVGLAISKQNQFSLFETPLTFTGNDAKVVIHKKGAGLIATIELAAELKIA